MQEILYTTPQFSDYLYYPKIWIYPRNTTFDKLFIKLLELQGFSSLYYLRLH